MTSQCLRWTSWYQIQSELFQRFLCRNSQTSWHDLHIERSFYAVRVKERIRKKLRYKLQPRGRSNVRDFRDGWCWRVVTRLWILVDTLWQWIPCDGEYLVTVVPCDSGYLVTVDTLWQWYLVTLVPCDSGTLWQLIPCDIGTFWQWYLETLVPCDSGHRNLLEQKCTLRGCKSKPKLSKTTRCHIKKRDISNISFLVINIIIIIIYLSWSWATCWPVAISPIQKSLQRSAMIPSASWGIVFHYPG